MSILNICPFSKVIKAFIRNLIVCFLAEEQVRYSYSYRSSDRVRNRSPKARIPVTICSSVG